ncbi:MAG: hypothetical protein ABEJ62_02430 [Candidatus Nanohaloarchaea archaeon]
MSVECKECGWEGTEDALEFFKCPKCGSRNLRTTAGRNVKDEEMDPPEGALKEGMSG